MAPASRTDKKWLQELPNQEQFAAIESEFRLPLALFRARIRAGLTQGELARKMGTTQPVVARLESGRSKPSLRTLERFAEATASRLVISFEAIVPGP